jgi:Raf kinase inhibitor-like YbhB/YbcL family protein
MRKLLTLTLALAVAITIAGAQQKGKGGGKGNGKGGPNLPPTIHLTVAGMTDGGRYPTANAAQGPSPALSWTVVPAGTQSFTILLHDPDPVLNKSALNDVTHWLIYNIPGTATSLPAGVAAGNLPDGTMQAANITGQPAYFGPAPPAGHGIHHYTFEIFALDTKLDVSPANRDSVMKAMEGHVLAKGLVIGLYSNE